MLSTSRALTVIMVAHNDSPTLRATLDRVYRALVITIEDFSVLIYDDGSTDETYSAAQTAAEDYPFAEVRRNARRLGVGHCIVQGSHAARSAFVVYIPADNTWPLRSFIELFGNLGKADVVTSHANNLLAAMPRAERTVSRAYTFILRALFRKRLRYYNGLTIYPADYLRQNFVRAVGFGFHAEALLKAVAAGYSFLEIALPIDEKNLPTAKSVTLANAVDAARTIGRLVFEFYVLRRASISRLKRVSSVVQTQGADEIGLFERREVRAEPVPAGERRTSSRIVICGASSGIGATLAQALAEDGHKVFICARRAAKLEEVCRGHANIESFVCDIADDRQVTRFVAALAERMDGIDVLINCAGGFGEIGPLALVDSDRWWQTIEVNLKGVFLAIKRMLPLLRQGHQPRIINMAGGGAFSPFPNFSAYACAKVAIVRLTECVAAELAAFNIRVNAISPGFVPTDMHQATLSVGEERAGRMQFQRTQAILNQGGPSMQNVVNCIRMLLSAEMDELTGKTISSNFDPWQTPTFKSCLAEIARSDLYTLRRINVVNLPNGRLRTSMSHPWLNEAERD